MPLFWIDQAGIGETLRLARTHLGLTLKQVSDKAGMAASHVWNFEHAERDLSLERFVSLCAALGLPPGELLAGKLFIDWDELFKLSQPHFQQHITEKSEKEWHGQDGENYVVLCSMFTASCATILLHALLTPEARLSFNYPSRNIRQALEMSVFRIQNDMPLRERQNYIDLFKRDPAKAIQQLGLLTITLLTDFAKHLNPKEPDKWWRPKPIDRMHNLITSEGHLLPDVDPLSLSRAMDEAWIKVNLEEVEARAVERAKPKNSPRVKKKP